MRGLSCAVIVAATIVVVAGDRHQTELKEHYDHLAYIAEFNCHKPQPRVISVHELFPAEDTAHKAFFPDVTVLHRCDNHVGCCPSGHVCRPKHTHPLNLPFKVTFLERMGKHKKGSWIIDYHTFDNHTECECVDASVCVPSTEHEVVEPHKPEHHSEHKGTHEPNHHEESSHEPDHHSEPSHHQSESHHEPDHHSQPSHHQSETHHEPDHHSEPSDHHDESHKNPEYHTESTHKTEQHSSSSIPEYKQEGNSESSSSVTQEDVPSASPSSPDDTEQESSTLPLLVNYILSSTTSSTTEKIDEKDLSSFFN